MGLNTVKGMLDLLRSASPCECKGCQRSREMKRIATLLPEADGKMLYDIFNSMRDEAVEAEMTIHHLESKLKDGEGL